MSPNYFHMSESETNPVSWLWPARIPSGKLTLLIGHPGVGKSLLAAELIATVTGGRQWPDLAPSTDPPPVFYPHQGGAVIVSLEDSPADTIGPRLAAMRAAAHLVAIVDGVRSELMPDQIMPFSLTAHLNLLAQAVRSVDFPRLLVLDTLTSLLIAPAADLSRYENMQTRTQTEALFELLTLARQRGIAVVAIAHLCKHQSSATVLRARAAMPFIAAARSILCLTTDVLDPEVRVLVSVKNTLGPTPPPLAFRVADGPTLNWLPQYAQRPNDLEDARDTRTILAEAAQWLRKTLATGPVPVSQLITEARELGFSARTIRRAKQFLGAKAIKSSNEARWEWTVDDVRTAHSNSTDNQGGQ